MSPSHLSTCSDPVFIGTAKTLVNLDHIYLLWKQSYIKVGLNKANELLW